MESNHTKIRMRQGYPSSPMLFIVLEALTRSIRQKKKMKGIEIGKEEVKLSIVADGILFTRHSKKKIPQKTSRNNQHF